MTGVPERANRLGLPDAENPLEYKTDHKKEKVKKIINDMVDSAVDECNHSLNGVFGQKDLFVYSCKCHMVGRAFRYYYMCL